MFRGISIERFESLTNERKIRSLSFWRAYGLFERSEATSDSRSLHES